MKESMRLVENCIPSTTQQEGCVKSSMTRERFAELVQLGLRASKELETHGLKRNEYCEFGRIMERIMQLE